MKISILTGAGISAESGIPTFRGPGGLWEGYRLEEVATPEAYQQDPELVLRFYNERRNGVIKAQPNEAHNALAKLDQYFDTYVITQNIDDLHERGGSKNILHLHGEILKGRSSHDPELIVELEHETIEIGHKAPDGSQLRPHVVWFGEAVPAMVQAMPIVAESDLLLIIGTSLLVYPAAGLASIAPSHCEIYVVDPASPDVYTSNKVHTISSSAVEAVPSLVEKIISQYS